MPHLTPERAYLYDNVIVPWTVRVLAVWILFDAYAPQLPPVGISAQWFLDWGEIAIIHAISVAGYVFRGEWHAVTLNGWAGFALLLAAFAVLRRIQWLYSWPGHLLLTKRTGVTVTPTEIAIGGRRFESEAVGQPAVMPHSDLGMETMRDQARREARRRTTGRWRYFQNAFEVVMPYYGEPVVVASIYGSKFRADQVAARITLARELALQRQAAASGGDDFGPGPTLPDEEEETAEREGRFWRRMGFGGGG